MRFADLERKTSAVSTSRKGRSSTSSDVQALRNAEKAVQEEEETDISLLRRGKRLNHESKENDNTESGRNGQNKEQQSYQCSACMEVFQQNSAFKRHENSTHASAAIKGFISKKIQEKDTLKKA